MAYAPRNPNLPSWDMKNRNDVVRKVTFDGASNALKADLMAWLKAKLGAPTLSPLAGDMLRMYLSQTYDQYLIDQVRKEIVASATFAQLAVHIDREIAAAGHRPGGCSETALKTVVDLALAKYPRDAETPGSIYFQNSDRGLQWVIGGVTGLRLQKAALAGGFYELEIELSDTYDFQNDRSNRPRYDALRKDLASALQAGDFARFSKLYREAWEKGSYLRLKNDPELAKTTVFASVMYAVERAGYFRGIPWSAVLHVSGQIHAPRTPARGLIEKPIVS